MGQARVPAQPLGIRDARERQLFRLAKILLDFTVEQTELLFQRRMAVLWQSLEKVFDHCAQTPRDLKIVRSTLPYFAECETNKIFPVWRANDHAQIPRSIRYFVRTQVPPSNRPQQTVELIYCKYRRCRVIDCWGQRFNCDIDDDAKGKGRVLFHR